MVRSDAPASAAACWFEQPARLAALPLPPQRCSSSSTCPCPRRVCLMVVHWLHATFLAPPVNLFLDTVLTQ